MTEITYNSLAEPKRAEQRAKWFHQGEQAAQDGLNIRDWPRPTQKYGVEWYACKVAWQTGFRYQRQEVEESEVLLYLEPNDLAPSDRALNILYQTIVATPMTKRRLLRNVNSHRRQAIKAKLEQLIQMGVFEQTGSGRKNDPFIIRIKPIKPTEPTEPTPDTQELAF